MVQPAVYVGSQAIIISGLVLPFFGVHVYMYSTLSWNLTLSLTGEESQALTIVICSLF